MQKTDDCIHNVVFWPLNRVNCKCILCDTWMTKIRWNMLRQKAKEVQ